MHGSLDGSVDGSVNGSSTVSTVLRRKRAYSNNGMRPDGIVVDLTP